MKALYALALKLIAFGLGFFFTFSFIVIGDSLYPAIWWPLTLGLTATAALGCSPSFRRSGGFFFWSAALLFGAMALHLATASPLEFKVTGGFAHRVLPNVVLFGGVGSAFYLLSLMIARHKAWSHAMMILCLGWLLAYFSGASGGADPMVAAFQRLLGVDLPAAQTLTLLVRKGVHLTFYGLLAWNASRLLLRGGVSRGASFVVPLLLALCWAGLDEMRQMGTSVRTGSIVDVGIDLAGALLGAGMALRPRKVRGSRSTRPV